jgi:hypothetical protein
MGILRIHGTHVSELFDKSSIRIIYYRAQAAANIGAYRTLATISLLTLFFHYFIVKAIEPQYYTQTLPLSFSSFV